MKASRAYLLNFGCAVILAIIPFTAFFTTWLGYNFNHLDLFRIWKEILLVPLGLIAISFIWVDKKLKGWLKRTSLLYLIIGYILLFVVAGLVASWRHQVNANALIYSWLSDLRFLVFFIVCLVAAYKNKWFSEHWRQVILIPAAAVIVFGLGQHFVLQPNFLSHFGYGAKTIPAYSTVDQKNQYIRVQSTLRGPNPLGAYLVLVVAVLSGLIFKDKRRRPLWLIIMAATILALFFTYSRSAEIGAAIAAGIIAWHYIRKSAIKRLLLIIAGLLIVAGVGSTLALRHNDRFQNIFFHTDEKSHSAESSNQSRSDALKSGLRDVGHEPWGRGPGTAGPASYRNNHPPRIAENYFLQIGQEVGIVGMALFIGINLMVGLMLWRQNTDLSIVLLASLIALTFINLLSHAWADDTLGLLWWGLAGISLSAILNTNKLSSNENKKTILKKA